jgi:DNA-binding PadR family transcriptional regulator
MNPKRIYKKTEKGMEEINSRKYGISQNLRHVLIFVDGKSDISKILEKGAGFPNIEQHLEDLASQGFIQSDDLTTISAIKDELIAVAQQTLGPDAEKIITKLRDAHETKEGLEETVSSCKRLVRLVIDEKKAEELMSRCSAILARL